MFRDSGFLNDLPADIKHEFTDLEFESDSQYKLKMLKQNINKKFVSTIYYYSF